MISTIIILCLTISPDYHADYATKNKCEEDLVIVLADFYYYLEIWLFFQIFWTYTFYVADFMSKDFLYVSMCWGSIGHKW